jgi:hypothetical protein
MSQPKHQLETFKSWAGSSSDISYYLNSHHIDFHEWVVGETARPVTVTALGQCALVSAVFIINPSIRILFVLIVAYNLLTYLPIALL